MNTKESNDIQNNVDSSALGKCKKLFYDSDDDDSFPEIDCDLCSKTFSNTKAYEQHLSGKKHHQMISKKRLVKKDGPYGDDDDGSFPEIDCDLCSKTFSNTKAYEKHLSGKKHHQMISKKRLVKKDGPSSDDDDDDTAPESIDELYCDTCKKTCSGYKSYVAHIKGNIHAKNVKQKQLRESLKDKPGVLAENEEVESEDDDLLPKPFAHCSDCNKVFYDPTTYQTHMKGSTHKKKKIHRKTLDGLKHEVEDDSQTDDDEEFFTKCEFCCKQFSGPVPFKIHLQSSVHDKQVKKVRAMEKLKGFFSEAPATGRMVCKECKKQFTDPFAFQQHLDNNSHGKQKVKDKIMEFVASNHEIIAMKSIENLSSDEETDEKIDYRKGYYFLVCKLCHVSFSGLESARDHVLSKKHIKAKEEKTKMKLLKKRMIQKQIGEEVINGVNGKVKNASSVPNSTTDVS